jgi:hypothetical protein
MDVGKRLLIERSFFEVRRARKELGESVGYDVADGYLLALVKRGELGARLFEDKVLKSG